MFSVDVFGICFRSMFSVYVFDLYYQLMFLFCLSIVYLSGWGECGEIVVLVRSSVTVYSCFVESVCYRYDGLLCQLKPTIQHHVLLGLTS